MSEEKVDMCYREYVKRVGFGVRRYNNRRNVNSNIISRTWVCSREGFRPAKHIKERSRQREARTITRIGCRAQF